MQRFTTVVAAVALACGLLTVPTARAAVPPVTPTTSVVEVTVGGIRSGVDGVTGLPGVQLGLFTAASGGTQITTCTSDTDGDCSLIVQNTGNGGANRGIRPWIRQLGAPTGWFSNLSLRTGDASGNTNVDRPYVFQTPALYGDQYQRFKFFAAGDNNAPTASGGTWQNSLDNPQLPSSCGLDVALILDLSGSISGQLSNLKSAANTFTDALVGTPSRMSLFSFSTLSPATGATGGNYPSLTSVSTQSQANAFKARYAGWSAGGNTNWDRGLAVPGAAGDTVDVAVMITDGNPSVSGQPATGPGGSTRFKEVEAGIFSANLLKSRGTRVLAVGVGSGVTATQTARNLAAISGPIKYTPATPNEDVADYYQSSTFTEVATALRDLALGNCAGSISVTKQLVPSGNTGEDVTGSQPAGAGWVFDASGSANVAVDPPNQRTTTADGTGTVNFPLTFSGGATSAPVTVAETQQTGHVLVTQNGQNAVCRNLVSGAAVPVTNTGSTAAPGFVVNASSTDPIGCTMYNRPPRPQATVEVAKQWVINGDPYDNGDQPDGFQADLELSGPGAAPASPQGWGVPRPGYQAGDQTTIDETADVTPDLCGPLTSTISGPGVDGAALPYTATLGADANAYTITNSVTCTSQLTLVKEVLNGDAEPEEWTLTATGPDGSQTGPTGTTGVTAEVTPDVDYTLAESGGNPNYEQQDVDLDPANRPWLCVTVAANGTVLRGFVDGSDGTVSVPLGARVTCTAYNQTALLGLRKLVNNDNGGTAGPGDWTLTATPQGAPPDVPAQTVDGTYPDYTYVDVRPGVTYVITETGPDGYTSSTTCDIVTDNPVGDPDPRSDAQIAVPALETAECTVTNTADPARLTLVKEVDNGATGGDATRADWTLTATDGTTTVSGSGDSADIADQPVPAGTYQLSETGGPEGYETEGWRCTGSDDIVTSVTLTIGQEATCTIVNTAQPSHLTLVKEVAGGSRGPADWTLRADGPESISGVSDTPQVTRVEVPIGRYALSEDGPTDYAGSDWLCQNGTDTPFTTEENLDVALGADLTCRITNSFVLPPNRARLTLVKQVENGGGGSAQPTAWTLTADGPVTISGPTGSDDVTQVEVPSGTYELSEADGPAGYAGSSWSCQNRTETPQQTASTLELAAGSDVRCIITNTYLAPGDTARLTLVKRVDNSGGGSAKASDWTLAADGPRAFSGRTATAAVTRVEVPAGTYELSEYDGPDDYTASGWDCQNGTDTPITTSGSIEVPAGGNVTCEITNTYDGSGPVPPVPPVPPLPPTGGPGFWPLVIGIALVVLAGGLLLVSRLRRPRAGRRTH